MSPIGILLPDSTKTDGGESYAGYGSMVMKTIAVKLFRLLVRAVIKKHSNYNEALAELIKRMAKSNLSPEIAEIILKVLAEEMLSGTIQNHNDQESNVVMIGVPMNYKINYNGPVVKA